MEDQNKLNQALSEKMSAEHSDIDAPPLHKLDAARKIVQQRGGQNEEREDIFSLLAGFLNMKIRLYHAVIATVIIAGVIFYFSKEDSGRHNEAQGIHYESNIAAVNNPTVFSGISVSNSTVLSSINTFIIRK